MEIGIARARAAGLTFRPIAGSVRDTLAWDRTRSADTDWHAGLKRAGLLQAWRERDAATP